MNQYDVCCGSHLSVQVWTQRFLYFELLGPYHAERMAKLIVARLERCRTQEEFGDELAQITADFEARIRQREELRAALLFQGIQQTTQLWIDAMHGMRVSQMRAFAEQQAIQNQGFEAFISALNGSCPHCRCSCCCCMH